MSRATDLIQQLGLHPHPEGGHYAEIFRSAERVIPADGRGARDAVTCIYFLLARGEHSALHRVTSDELWHHVEGAPLELIWTADSGVERIRVGSSGTDDATPVAVVPAGAWQAARTTGDFTLVACTVGPGFDFADFAMARDVPEGAEIVARHPSLRELL